MGFGKKIFGGMRKRTPAVSKASASVSAHDNAQLQCLPHLHRASAYEHEVTESIPDLPGSPKRNYSVMSMPHEDISARTDIFMKRSASMKVLSLQNDALMSINVGRTSPLSCARFSMNNSRILQRRVDSWSTHKTQARETSGQQDPVTLTTLPWSAQMRVPGVLIPEDFLGVPHSGLREYVRKLCVWNSGNYAPSSAELESKHGSLPKAKGRKFGIVKSKTPRSELRPLPPEVPLVLELEYTWGTDGHEVNGVYQEDDEARELRIAQQAQTRRMVQLGKGDGERETRGRARPDLQNWVMVYGVDGFDDPNEDKHNKEEKKSVQAGEEGEEGPDDKQRADSFSLEKELTSLSRAPSQRQSRTPSPAPHDDSSESVYSRHSIVPATSLPVLGPKKRTSVNLEQPHPVTLDARSSQNAILANFLGETDHYSENHAVLSCGWRLLHWKDALSVPRFGEFQTEMGNRGVWIAYLGGSNKFTYEIGNPFTAALQRDGFILRREEGGHRISRTLSRALSQANWQCSKSSSRQPSLASPDISSLLLCSLPVDPNSNLAPTIEPCHRKVSTAPSWQPVHDPQTCSCPTKIKRVLVCAVIVSLKTSKIIAEDVVVSEPGYIMPLRIETFGWRPENVAEVRKYAEMVRRVC